MLEVAAIAGGMGKALIGSLKTDSDRLKQLAEAEAQKLATALATIARLLVEGVIDREEAETLIELQKSASEAVLASLKGSSAVIARRAVKAALASAVTTVDGVVGFPLVGTIVGSGRA